MLYLLLEVSVSIKTYDINQFNNERQLWQSWDDQTFSTQKHNRNKFTKIAILLYYGDWNMCIFQPIYSSSRILTFGRWISQRNGSNYYILSSYNCQYTSIFNHILFRLDEIPPESWWGYHCSIGVGFGFDVDHSC